MRLDYKRTVCVGLAFMTISAFWQLYNSEIPLMLQNLIGKDKQFIINIIMSLDNISALFLLPLFGSISDRTHTRIGRRMPYILLGTVLAALFMIWIPITFNKGMNVLFFVMVGGVLLAMSIYRSPAVALMPDVTPKPLRSQGNAVINLMGAVGIIFSQALLLIFKGSRNYLTIFIIVAVFMIVSLVVMMLTIDENKLVSMMPPEVETDEERIARENRGVKIKGGVRRSLLLLLISVFLWYLAYSAIETNYSRYAEDVWHMVEGEYTKPMMFGTIVALISFVPLGIGSKVLGRRKTVLVGLGVLFGAVTMISFIVDYSPVLYLLFALIGVSWAAINVNSYPMVVEMSRGADVGKYTGLYYTFSMAAQIATPLITGFLFDILPIKNRVLFPYAAFFLLVALVTVIFVRHGDAPPDSDKKLDETPDKESVEV